MRSCRGKIEISIEFYSDFIASSLVFGELSRLFYDILLIESSSRALLF